MDEINNAQTNANAQEGAPAPAEGKDTPAAGNGAQNGAQPPEKTFTQKELDDIVRQRVARATNGQPPKEELEEFRRWKEAQKTPEQKKAEQDSALADAQREASDLKAQMAQMRLDAALKTQALAMGVGAANADYIARLADTKGVMDEDGGINTEKLTAAINKVVTDIPALKSEGSKGFQQIGADSSDTKQPTAEEKLRRAFGLKN